MVGRPATSMLSLTAKGAPNSGRPRAPSASSFAAVFPAGGSGFDADWGTLTAQGSGAGLVPRLKAYPVVATFKLGMNAFDSGMVIMPFNEGMRGVLISFTTVNKHGRGVSTTS